MTTTSEMIPTVHAVESEEHVPRSPQARGRRMCELDELPLLIGVPRAAKLLGISRSAAYRCASAGELPTTHLGGRVYVVTAKLQDLLESA